MLCVKPVDEAGIAGPVFEKYHISSGNARLLMADERGTVLGFVLVEPKGDRLYLHALEIYGSTNRPAPDGGAEDSAEIFVSCVGKKASGICEHSNIIPLLEK